MSTETIEFVTLCDALSAAKRAVVTDFARFLLERSARSYGLNAKKVYPENSPATLRNW